MSWWTPERKRYALDYLIHNGGLSYYGAAGLVSRWANVESSGGPSSINPSSHAFGIAQWLGARLTPIRGNTNFDAQLAYVVRELNGSETRAGNALRSARSIAEAARGASMYERAENYNPSSGTDNWTAKTAAGIPDVYALIPGGGVPANVAEVLQSRPLTVSDPSNPVSYLPSVNENGDVVVSGELNPSSTGPVFSGNMLLLLGL